jgi:hypothetical protein
MPSNQSRWIKQINKQIKTTMQLTLKERLFIYALLDGYKGGISKIKQISEDIKNVAITVDEWKEAGRVNTIEVEGVSTDYPFGDESVDNILKDGGKFVGYKWDEAKVLKEIEFQGDTTEYITEKLKEIDSKGEVSLKDTEIVSLFDKFVK